MNKVCSVCSSRSFRIFQIIFVGLLFMNADCPPPDGNINNNANSNSNSNENNNSNGNVSVVEVPDNNVLGLTAAIVTAINFPTQKILVYENPATADGNVAPALTIDAPPGFRVMGLDINSAGELIMLNSMGIHVYATASDIANSMPSRTVPSTGIMNLQRMALDRGRDLLYVWSNDDETPIIRVYENVSDPGFDGEVEPLHTITNPVLAEKKVNSFTVSPDDRLYVFTQTDSPQKMLVFDNANSLDGEVVADRTVDFTEYQTNEATLLSVPTVDADDNLIAGAIRSAGGNLQFGIASIANASTLDGEVTGTAFLDVSPAGVPFWLAVHNGEGFVTQQGNIAIYDAIAGREGEPIPDRNLSGDDTQIFAPSPLLVYE